MARSKLTFENPLISTGAEEKKKEPTERKKPGRPRNKELVRGGVQDCLPPEYTRFALICKTANVKDLKDYAYTRRISIKDAFDEIVEKFFKDYRRNKKNEPLLDHTGGKH